MSFFQNIVRTDLFSTLLDKLNTFATACTSGSAEFNELVLGTSYKELIPFYLVDSTAPPTIESLYDRTMATFSSNFNQYIYFEFPVSNFKNLNENRKVKLSYTTDTTTTPSVISLNLEYTIIPNAITLSSVITGSTNINITASTVAFVTAQNSDLTITAGTNISSKNSFIKCKLWRNSTGTDDSYEGNFNLFNIEII